jgi:hypothetical protein
MAFYWQANLKQCMKEKEMDQNKAADPNLDTPSESNRQKHINFMDVEEESGSRRQSDNRDDSVKQRREEWQKGLEEGASDREDRKEASRTDRSESTGGAGNETLGIP